MNVDEGMTIIGKSVKIVGDLSGSEDLVMDGELHGTIYLPGARLTIGPAARVRGDVAAKEIVVFGRLDGDMRATGRVELRASAMVQGNIYASTLSIEENAAYRGQIDPSRAGEPMPERASTSSPLRLATPATYSLTDGFGTSLPRSSAQLPTVAAVKNSSEPVAEGEDRGKVASLFAETEA